MFERGSPSLVGRGIANPMFGRTRGFESHSPRFKCGFYKKNKIKWTDYVFRTNKDKKQMTPKFTTTINHSTTTTTTTTTNDIEQ